MSSSSLMPALVPIVSALLGACAGDAASAPRVEPTSAIAAPAAAPEKPVITTIEAGLADEHRAQKPLLDRVELQSHGRVRGTRTYADGTQYLILSDPKAPAAGESALAWTRFVRITPAGIERVRQVIRESVLGYQGAPPTAGPSGDAGTITWVVYLDNEERVVRTASGTYDRLPAFVRQLDEAVSQNVERAE